MELGKKYLIALPVDDAFFEEIDLEPLKGKVDIFEFRIDQFNNLDVDYIKNLMKLVKQNDFSIILTIRSKEEGGTDITDEERKKLFELLIEYSDIIDIELSSKLNRQIVELAKDNRKISLVSYHDFEKTPDDHNIQMIIDKGKNLGADIVKYAFKINSEDDVARLMSITYKNKDKNLISIGMGPLGRITRVCGFFFGSLITYTYIGKSFAPGQIELDTLIKELQFYGLR